MYKRWGALLILAALSGPAQAPSSAAARAGLNQLDPVVAPSNAGLNAALNAARGGETFRLPAGDYGDVVIGCWNCGPKFAPSVTLTAADPAHPPRFSSLRVQNSAGLVFDHILVAARPGQSGVALQDSSQIVMQNSIVRGIDRSGTGVMVRASAEIRISANDIGEVGSGILSYKNVGPTAYQDNYVHDVASDGIDVFGDAQPTVTGNYVRGFRPAAGDHPDGIQFASLGVAGTVIASDNLVVGELAPGGALPPQGVFVSDGPYAHATVNDNLVICTLYNGLMVTEASGEALRNQVIPCGAQPSGLRLANVHNFRFGANRAGGYVTNENNMHLDDAGANRVARPIGGVGDAGDMVAAWLVAHTKTPR